MRGKRELCSGSGTCTSVGATAMMTAFFRGLPLFLGVANTSAVPSAFLASEATGFGIGFGFGLGFAL